MCDFTKYLQIYKKRAIISGNDLKWAHNLGKQAHKYLDLTNLWIKNDTRQLLSYALQSRTPISNGKSLTSQFKNV